MLVNNIHAHEASHAVCGVLVGYDIEEARSLPGSAFVQAGAFRGAPAGASILVKMRSRMRADAVFALGGAAGESEFTHEPVRTILGRCDEDRRTARKAAVGYALTLPEWHPDLHQQVLEDFLRQARRLVRQNWCVIETLAERLALNGNLIGADVLRVIELAGRKAA